MKSYNYKIVWADDEIDSLFEHYKSIFEELKMEVTKFYNSNDAINYIEQNPRNVDGIITDAKFSRHGEPINDKDKSLPGLTDFMTNLKALNLKCKKNIPCLILTGYGNYLYEHYTPSEILDVFLSVLDKNASYDIKKQEMYNLCKEIKKVNSLHFKIRNKYTEICQNTDEKYLGTEIEKKIYYLLSCIEKKKGGNFQEIRAVIEKIFNKLNVLSFFPDNYDTMNNRAKYINNIALTPLIPDHIAKHIRFIVQIVQPACHIESDISKELIKGKAPYLFQSVMYSLMDVLVWFPSFINDYNKDEVEKYKKEINFEPRN